MSGCENDRPCKVGFIAGITGGSADTGITALDAVELTIREANEKGGINGRKVELIVKNVQFDQDVTREGMEQLLGENVDAVIGPVTSEISMAVIPLLYG